MGLLSGYNNFWKKHSKKLEQKRKKREAEQRKRTPKPLPTYDRNSEQFKKNEAAHQAALAEWRRKKKQTKK